LSTEEQRKYWRERTARYRAKPEKREAKREQRERSYQEHPERLEASRKAARESYWRHRERHLLRFYEATKQCELFAGVVLAAFVVLSDAGKRGLASRLVNMTAGQDRVAFRVARRFDVDMTLADYYAEARYFHQSRT
jgi:hypothetical protein